MGCQFGIVLIDDDAATHQQIADIVDTQNRYNEERPALGSRSWSLRSFFDTGSAWQFLSAEPPTWTSNIVICDLTFESTKAGFEFLSRLNALRADLPCIVLSQSISREDRRRSFESGALAYINKLSDEAETWEGLSQVIEDVLALSTGRKKLVSTSGWANVYNGTYHLAHDLSKALDIATQKSKHVRELIRDSAISASVESEFGSLQDSFEFLEEMIRPFTLALNEFDSLPQNDIQDLCSLVKEVYSTGEDYWYKRYNKDEIDFVFDCNMGCMSNCDRRRVKRVIFNLIDNAVKFTPGHCTIEFKLEESRPSPGLPCWKLSITDNGPGVPNEHLSRIDQPLTRLDNSNGIAGWGFGLHICKTLLETYSDSIGLRDRNPRFNSPMNGGLCAEIFLPKISD